MSGVTNLLLFNTLKPLYLCISLLMGCAFLHSEHVGYLLEIFAGKAGVLITPLKSRFCQQGINRLYTILVTST
jgi:hypothetical protein